MTIKSLSFDEMRTKLGDMLDGRPHIASIILSGQASFSEKGETYALRGSPALTRGEPELVTREAPAVREQRHESSTERLYREAHAQIASEERSAPAEPRPRLTPPAAEPTPAKAGQGHAKIADRLDGKASSAPPALQTRDSRIATQRAAHSARAHVFELPAATAQKAHPNARVEAQRADERVRSIGHVRGKTPASIASRLGDGPKGAA